jgi:CubicO group peptidase (beta-lactamase class C family)
VGILLDRGTLGSEGVRDVRLPVAELLPDPAPAPLPEPLAAVAATPLHDVLVGTSTGDTAAIAALLTAATGRPVPDLARELLFAPLGVDPPWTGRGPEVTAEEMAAVAELWLDRGAVDGRQVVPARWMDLAVRPHARTGRHWLPDAGYRQWVTRVDRHAAVVLTGEDGQLVEVVPGLDLVVVVGCDEDPAPDVAIPASSEAFVELVSSTVLPVLG